MPTDQRSPARAERCFRHPGAPAIATCDGCRRPLCITCATPVRGLVYGNECLPADLGDDGTPGPGRPPLDRATAWQGVGLATAVLATFLPWTRFGSGSGMFGAWDVSWAGLAAIAFTLGAAAWLADRLRPSRFAGGAATALAAVGLAASVIALARPPVFARPWLGHWLAIGGGTLAVGAALLGRRGRLPTVARRRPRLG